MNIVDFGLKCPTHSHTHTQRRRREHNASCVQSRRVSTRVVKAGNKKYCKVQLVDCNSRSTIANRQFICQLSRETNKLAGLTSRRLHVPQMPVRRVYVYVYHDWEAHSSLYKFDRIDCNNTCATAIVNYDTHKLIKLDICRKDRVNISAAAAAAASRNLALCRIISAAAAAERCIIALLVCVSVICVCDGSISAVIISS